MKKKLQFIAILCIDIALIALIIYYPFYIEKAAADKSIGYCFSKNFLGIYCITCGGTRAFGDMLSFDFISAIKHNVLVFCGFVYVIYLNVYCIYAHVKRKPDLIYFKMIFCLYIILGLIAFVIVRNLLVYTFGIDPIGDILG